MTTLFTGRRVHFASALLFGCIAVALPSHAEVGLRVQSHPITAPIDAYVRVTEGNEPVAGLTPADFAVTLDGAPIEFALTLPPNQDSSQKTSVVIVVRHQRYFPTPDLTSLVRQLGNGSMVSVVKYWSDVEVARIGGLSVLPFTELDGAGRSRRVTNFLEDPPPSEWGTPHLFFDGVMEALSQFEMASATLPVGPKAIVTVDCCGGRGISLSDVVARANAGGIAIFDMIRGPSSRQRDTAAHLRALAMNTGGVQVKLPNGAPSEDALPMMASWLEDGYRVSIPRNAISGCGRHKLAVTVHGESTHVVFSRCDITPETFTFRDRRDAPVARRVRSNTVTITGIDIQVPVRVYGGEYSIGCTSTFTSEPGRIRPGETVCVRHHTASSGGLEVYTLLVVGGVSSWFASSTVF